MNYQQKDISRQCKNGCGAVVSKVGHICDMCADKLPGTKNPCFDCGRLISSRYKRCDIHILEAKAGSRAMKRPPISVAIRRAVLIRDDFTCQGCGLQVASFEDARGVMQMDHIVSHVSGGPTTVENLQTMCAKCNRKKWYISV